jgi:hypothetical protein
MSRIGRWRGLVALVGDAVEHGSRAIQRVQIETARRPFTILEHVPPIAAPAKIAHAAHDLSVTFVHGTIRAVNAVAGKTVDVILEQVELNKGGHDTVEHPAREHSAEEHHDDSHDADPHDGC